MREVADAKLCATIHRQGGDVLAINRDSAALGHDQPGHGVKRGRLAGPVRPQQGNNLAPVQLHREVADDGFLAVGFTQVFDAQTACAIRDRQIRGRHQLLLPVCRIVFTRPDICAVPSDSLTLIVSELSALRPWVSNTFPDITIVPVSMS